MSPTAAPAAAPAVSSVDTSAVNDSTGLAPMTTPRAAAAAADLDEEDEEMDMQEQYQDQPAGWNATSMLIPEVDTTPQKSTVDPMSSNYDPPMQMIGFWEQLVGTILCGCGPFNQAPSAK